MKKNFGSIVVGVIVLVVIILLCCGFFYLCYVGLTKLASNVDAVIVVALITATVSLVTVIISTVVGKRIDYKKSREKYLAEKREKPYQKFIEMNYKMFANHQNTKDYINGDLNNDLLKFSEDITLWGSKNVVKKWMNYRYRIMKNPKDLKNLLFLEDLINEMREDLGTKKSERKEILGFFINDIEKLPEGENSK